MRTGPIDPMPRAYGPKQRYLASRSDGARLHAGIDLGARRGTPVRAPEDGVVEAVGAADSLPPIDGWRFRGYGPELVLMRGDSGRWHLLSHLQNASVQVGQRVTAGEAVGEVSRLAHCHWEVLTRARPGRGQSVAEISLDPLAWLDGREVAYDGRAPERPGSTLSTPSAHRVPRARPTSPPVSTGGQPPGGSHGSESDS